MPPEETKTQDNTAPAPTTPDVVIEQPVVEQKEPVEAETVTTVEIPQNMAAPEKSPEETAPEIETAEEQEESPQIQTEIEKQTPETPAPQPQIRTEVVYQTPPNLVQNLLTKARAKIQERKRKKLDRMLTLFTTKQKITNKDVQKLLRTTDRTTRRYFDQLEKEGRVKQVGTVGRDVFYEKAG